MKNQRPTCAAPAVVLSFFCAPVIAGTNVAVCTDLGRLTIELEDEKAPQHTENFLAYVDQGFYTDTVFHRVIAGFVVQGGGFDSDLRQKPTRPPVPNESRNGLENTRGTISAARTSDPHSATSQFYVNLNNNEPLNATARDFGYTVFGRVTDGMDVVDAIAALPTGAAGPFGDDVPEPLVAVTSMARLDSEALASIPSEGRADTLKRNLAAAVEAGSYVEALEWITHLRASCETMDPDLLLTEARVAVGLLRAPRARAVLDEYFDKATDAHAGQDEARRLQEQIGAAQDRRTAAMGTAKRIAGSES